VNGTSGAGLWPRRGLAARGGNDGSIPAAMSVMRPSGGDPAVIAAWNDILRSYRLDEAQAVASARERLAISDAQRKRIVEEARRLAATVRATSAKSLRAEAFLQRYSLSTPEGVVLLCLAAALLRIP